MRKHLSIFWCKGFIIGLFILLINDHFLKAEFHNWITGKLSDIAGLFIFPIFFSALFPKYKKHIYWTTAIGFIWWKSPFAEGFIEFFNGLNVFTMTRVIDYTDLIALAILPFSYHYFNSYKNTSFRLTPLPVIVVAAFGFIATSRAGHIPAFYRYSFPYGKTELVRRLNIIAAKDKQLPISIYIENANHTEIKHQDTLLFFVSGFKEYRDTFYTKNGAVDTVRKYQIPIKDTAYISKDVLYYQLDFQKYFKKNKKDYCNTIIAKIEITGDERNSSIYVTGFDTYNCLGVFDKGVSEEMHRLQEVFEKELNKKPH